MHILGGIVLAFDFPKLLWEAYRQELLILFQLPQAISSDYQSLLTMIVRLFGATVASWGGIMWILVNVIQEHGVAKYRLPFVVAILIWFVLDCSISFWFGAHLHLMVNTLALTSILIPLFLLEDKN